MLWWGVLWAGPENSWQFLSLLPYPCQAMVKIAPSLLSADFSCLGQEIAQVAPVSDLLHVDVMDGHFVENLTIGPPVVASVRQVTSLPLDCHLMMMNPGFFLEAFAKAGADSITLHIETLPDPTEELARLSDLGLGRGLTLKPDTPLSAVEPYLDLVDLLLIMTVHPGFGGQAFREDQLPKIAQAASLLARRGLDVEIEVDGGISAGTARRVVDAGATILVAGSAIFGARDPKAAVASLREAAGSPV